MNQTTSPVKMAEYYDVTVKTIYDWFKSYNHQIKFFTPDRLKLQKSFIELLRKNFPEYLIEENNNTEISPKELDIWIPEKRIAIELNGLYWHRNDKHRHNVKLSLCEQKNIRLLQFWDIELIDKEQIVLSIIRNALGKNDRKIGASKTKIKSLDTTAYQQFLEENHLQGYAPSSIRYGLFYKEELVAVMGFAKSRYDKTYDYELIRFTNKNNTSVTGAFQKLLKQIDGSLISYVDRRMFTGSAYENAGFTLHSITSPNYFWFKGQNILSRIQTQKHKLQDLLGEKFDSDLSEKDNMIRAGWDRVFDCGHYKYIKENSGRT